MTEQTTENEQVSIASDADTRELLRKMAKLSDRSMTAQLRVIIREAAERAGLMAVSE